MTTFKKAGQGIVANAATANLTNVAVGDMVAVIGDGIVGHDATKRIVGEVVAKDASKTTDNVTVEFFANKILKMTASGAISGGNLVKAGATKNTVVAVTEATLADTWDGFGVAFQAAADGETLIVIPL